VFLKVGKYMMAAALTLAAVTTVFVLLFFRDRPEPVVAAEPAAETSAETTGPEDYSQPWLDIPDPKPAPEPRKAAPEPVAETVAEPAAKSADEPVVETAPLEKTEYGPLPDRGDLEAASRPRRYELGPDAIMGLTVPAMGIYNAPVFDSDRRWALNNGVAHVPETSLPWTAAPQRNVYLAGHRLGWPGTGSHLIFYRLGTLGRGDTVILKDRRGRAYRYRVTETFIANPGDSWVMGQVRGRDMVTLQTCTPIPAFNKRIIVRADRI
jgi:sortase A